MPSGAINDGHIYRFVAKPWDDEELVEIYEECTAMHETANKSANRMPLLFRAPLRVNAREP
jgi:hypothetical protein